MSWAAPPIRIKPQWRNLSTNDEAPIRRPLWAAFHLQNDLIDGGHLFPLPRYRGHAAVCSFLRSQEAVIFVNKHVYGGIGF